MDLERDLEHRLRSNAASISAEADIDEVYAAASDRRRRARRMATGAAAVVAAVGVGGVFIVADRDPAPPVDQAAQAPSVAPTVPADGDTQDGGAPPATDSAVSTVVIDREAPPADVSPATDPRVVPAGGTDPADQYLDRTTEIYHRTLPGGEDVVVRLSEASYGDLFGIEWSAPTGTAELCVGHPAALIGGVSRSMDWPSAWAARQWMPLTAAQPTHVEALYLGEHASLAVIRTSLPAVEVAVSAPQLIPDRTAVVDGVAVLELAIDRASEGPLFSGDDEPLITLTADPARSGSPELIEIPLYSQDTRPEVDPACQPPPPPTAMLPAPGTPPADPAAAEAEIRARHALLVDQSVGPEDKEGLVDDDSGIAKAREQMEAGPFAESAAGAEYTLEEFVFTDPATAWFRYTIVAPTGVFADRIGQATFDGEVWQITRQTICQDLTLASGYCDGDRNPTPMLSPFDDAELEAMWQEWTELVAPYRWVLECDPLAGCW